jgi:CBS domain-containing protein
MNARTVRTLMTHDVVTARPDSGFKDIVDAMTTRRVSALPVVAADGQVVGIVSEADLLYKLERPEHGAAARLISRQRREATAKAAGDTAADLMTTPVVTIRPEATAGAAARLMHQHEVKRLPVVDGDGRLVGIVARRDLLATYLRPDEEIRTEIRDEVLLGDMLIGPSEITATVHDGVVTLAGAVDRRSTAQIVDRLIRGVAGVVDVVGQLRWQYDDRDDLRRHYVFDAEIRPLARRVP